MKKRQRRPYRQGRLDSLCGPYSMVNVIHALRGPLSKEQAVELLIEILTFLEKSQPVLERIEWGTGTREMWRLIARISEKYELDCLKPFVLNKQASLAELWSEMLAFYRNTQGVMLIGIEHRDWSHWTVIKQISRTRLVLFDSGDLKVVYRKRCSVDAPTDTHPYQLFPTTLHCLWPSKGLPKRPIK